MHCEMDDGTQGKSKLLQERSDSVHSVIDTKHGIINGAAANISNFICNFNRRSLQCYWEKRHRKVALPFVSRAGSREAINSNNCSTVKKVFHRIINIFMHLTTVTS